MLSKLKSKATNNFFFLSVIRFFNIVTKFLLISYLVRILGKENFGLLTWSEAIIQYFIIFINFGFNIFGAKLIVENKENPEQLREVVSSIFIIKFAAFLISVIILIGLYISNTLEADFFVLLILLLGTIGDFLFPVWYYQGIENLKPLAIAVVIAKSTLIIGTFILITESTDLKNYVILFAFSHIMMGIISFYKLNKEISLSFLSVKRKQLKLIFKRASYYFLGNISTLVFNFFTIFIIGYFFSKSLVTVFDISIKIIFLFILPFEILQAAILPQIAKEKNKCKLTKTAVFSVIIGVVIYFFLILFGKNILYFFSGENTLEFYKILKKLALLSIIAPCIQILGNCGLVAFNQDKKYNYALIGIAIFYFIITLILYKLEILTFNNIINLRIIADYILFIIIVVQSYRSGIFNFKLQR